MPVRLQRKRTKGYRLPPDAVYVGRPSRWGNPFIIGQPYLTSPTLGGFRVITYREPGTYEHGVVVDICADRAQAVAWFREFYAELDEPERDVTPLRGRDLACWCEPSSPCHADVLLELANR